MLDANKEPTDTRGKGNDHLMDAGKGTPMQKLSTRRVGKEFSLSKPG
jgi:hypothetical protein